MVVTSVIGIVMIGVYSLVGISIVVVSVILVMVNVIVGVIWVSRILVWFLLGRFFGCGGVLFGEVVCAALFMVHDGIGLCVQVWIDGLVWVCVVQGAVVTVVAWIFGCFSL